MSVEVKKNSFKTLGIVGIEVPNRANFFRILSFNLTGDTLWLQAECIASTTAYFRFYALCARS